MMGTPSEEDVFFMNPKFKYQEVVKVKPVPIHTFFPQSTPDEAFNLMLGLLTYHPQKRI